ncbi:MAG: DUF3108 domain-containing protein [Bacteroidetes bacterium]|nr:DUF3108 domain-containing protein [Bacteroidota bacterium]
MAHRTAFLFMAACGLSFGFAQDGTREPAPATGVNVLRTLDYHAFAPGEKLSYVLHYGWLNAGTATLELKEYPREIGGRKVLHAVGLGESTGAFKAFFKVDDRYETYFDQSGVFPYIFVRRVDEGGYKFSQDYTFMQRNGQVATQDKKTYEVPAHVQDMLSAFYYARTINFDQAKAGDVFTIETFLDNELWPLRMRYIGKETIKLRNGKYRCLKFQPVVQEGRIFKDNNDLNVWITDDGNRIPVLAQAKVLVGSIKMELSGYEGLANPIARE